MTAVAAEPQTDRLFPTLTAQQLDRLATYGTRRPIRGGETLMEPGDQHPACFVMLRGSVEILRVENDGETLVQLIQPGQFSGEVNLLTGRAAFVRIRARDDGDVL